jgi:hypothetical protein
MKLEAEKSVTLSELKRSVREGFNLTEHDLSQSQKRSNELMYEQRCRNLNSHKSFPANKINYENQVFTLR